MRDADQAVAPAAAGAQQQLGVARHQLEDLHELDVEDVRDGRDHLVEQLLQVGLGERLLAEARDRLLLLGAHAQFAQQLLPVGHVAAGAEQTHRLAVFAGDDRCGALEPAVFLVGARRKPVVHVIGLAVAQAFLDRRHHFGLIFRMDVVLKAREGAAATGRCSSLPDHCMALDLMSHDHTPISPASSATRTESRSGNSSGPASRAVEAVCSC